MGKRKRILMASWIAISCLLSGCEAVFTFCPVAFLQRSTADMTPEQALSYAQDALSSGDQATMQKAYDSLIARIEAGSVDATTNYTAAELALELSGAPAVLTAAVTSLLSGTTPDLTLADLEDIDTDLLIAAAQCLQTAQGSGADLTAVDYVLGGVGIFLEEAGGDIAAIETMSAAQLETAVTAAAAFVTDGIADLGLSEDDPVAVILTQFSGLIGNL
jgi:hypothetical protein